MGSERLHARIVRALARQVLLAEQKPEPLAFPKEDELGRQLGVSRTILRESMKVLADKGMVEMKPRAGTPARPRSQWRLLDPDILLWQAGISTLTGNAAKPLRGAARNWLTAARASPPYGRPMKNCRPSRIVSECIARPVAGVPPSR